MPGGATLVVDVVAAADLIDILVAELADLGFDGFIPAEAGLRAYGEHDALLDIDDSLAAILARYGVHEAERRIIPSENWNADWEATVQPVIGGTFVVYPPWAEPTPGYIPIRVEPKMSFGTGHHETTRLMLELMPSVVTEGSTVLDAGTGTGVLAVAAIHCGAAHVTGFDNDPWSVRNATETAGSNGFATRIDVREGGLSVAPDGPFDVIMANINRNVIIEMLPGFRSRMNVGGYLVLSGLLIGDQPVIRSAVAESGYSVERDLAEGPWWAVICRATT